MATYTINENTARLSHEMRSFDDYEKGSATAGYNADVAEAAAILERVNRQLCENNTEEMFVTVWLGILEISTGRLTCANAGHEYPALRRPSVRFAWPAPKHGALIAAQRMRPPAAPPEKPPRGFPTKTSSSSP